MHRKGSEVFVIDICGTIFRSNTTLDFMKFFWGDRLVVKLLFSLPFRVFNRLMYHLFRLEPLRMFLIYRLKGMHKKELLQKASLFYEKYLSSRMNSEVIDLIDSKRKEGYTLVLLSATLDVIAAVVSEKMHIPLCLSSQLEYSSDEVCMGRLKLDLLANKLDVLASQVAQSPYGGVVTDNYTDSQLIEVSHDSYLVCYGESESKWNNYLTKQTIERCHYIKV